MADQMLPLISSRFNYFLEAILPDFFEAWFSLMSVAEVRRMRLMRK